MESFLSKDISYLVSSKKEAKFAPTVSQISPVPSPESVCNGGNGTSHRSNRKDRQDGSSFKAADAVSFSNNNAAKQLQPGRCTIRIFLLSCFLMLLMQIRPEVVFGSSVK